MNFEFDDNKSNSNREKHGIDFIEAKKLWNDIESIELQSKNSIDEQRFLTIGKIDKKFYTAISTYRGQNIRIISVRRSRKKEIELYESNRFR